MSLYGIPSGGFARYCSENVALSMQTLICNWPKVAQCNMGGNDDGMPWESEAEATLKQKEMEVVSCGNCGYEWVPQVERPKFCTNCNFRLEYGDEAVAQPDDDDSSRDEDDLETLFDEGDSE